jgi:hypothetical protein
MENSSLLNNFEKYYNECSFISQQDDRDEVKRFADLADKKGKALHVLDLGCAQQKVRA